MADLSASTSFSVSRRDGRSESIYAGIDVRAVLIDTYNSPDVSWNSQHGDSYAVNVLSHWSISANLIPKSAVVQESITSEYSEAMGGYSYNIETTTELPNYMVDNGDDSVTITDGTITSSGGIKYYAGAGQNHQSIYEVWIGAETVTVNVRYEDFSESVTIKYDIENYLSKTNILTESSEYARTEVIREIPDSGGVEFADAVRVTMQDGNGKTWELHFNNPPDSV